MGLLSLARGRGTGSRRESVADAAGTAIDAAPYGTEINNKLQTVENFDNAHPFASGTAVWVAADGVFNNFESSDAMIDVAMDLEDGDKWAEFLEEFPLTEVPANVGDATFDSIQGAMQYIQEAGGLEDENLDIAYIGTEAIEKAAAVAEQPFEYVSDPGEGVNDIANGRFPVGDDTEVYNNNISGYFQDVLGLEGDAVQSSAGDGAAANGTDTGTPEPGADYNFGSVLDANDQEAFNAFFQDVGNVESVDMYWEGSENGTGHYVLEATSEGGGTETIDLVENGSYEGHDYHIDGNEMNELIQARDSNDLWDVFDESQYLENRG